MLVEIAGVQGCKFKPSIKRLLQVWHVFWKINNRNQSYMTNFKKGIRNLFLVQYKYLNISYLQSYDSHFNILSLIKTENEWFFEYDNHWINLFFDQILSFWITSSFELRMIYNIQLFSYILEILNTFHNFYGPLLCKTAYFVAKGLLQQKCLFMQLCDMQFSKKCAVLG